MFGVIVAIVASVVVAAAVLAKALTEAGKDADSNFSNRPVGKTQTPCPKVEYELVELVEVVTQDKEKWVKGAGMDTTEISDKLERTEKDGSGFKQYINLDKDLEGQSKRHPEYGREITFKVRVKQKDGKTDKLAGVKIKFSNKCTKAGNRANPDSKIWSDANLTGDQKHGFGSKNGNTTEIAQTNDKGWAGPVSYFVSMYGGDQFEISAELDPSVEGAKGSQPKKTKKYVVWRKFWYQMTYAKGFAAKQPTGAEKVYEEVFAEMVKSSEKKFKKDDLPEDLKNRTFLKEYMLKKGGANKDVAVIGAHNKNEFAKKPIYDKTKPKGHSIKSNLIICEYQCDPATDNNRNPAYSGLGKFLITKNGQEITLPQGAGGAIVSKPALRAGKNLVVKGEWSKKMHPWHKEGDLKDENIDINPSRTSTLSVKIDLSKGGIGATPSSSNVLYVKLQVDTAESFLGESFGKGQILCVYLPTASAGKQGSEEDFNDTVAHELGHMWDQSPESANKPKSLKNHPLQYVAHGGSGSHCRHGATASVKKQGNNLYIASQDANTTITKTTGATKTHQVVSTAGFIAGHKVKVNNVEKVLAQVTDATHLKFTTSFAATQNQPVRQELTFSPVNWNDSNQKWPSPYKGDCLMYHSFSKACSHKFCKVCKPYLQLQDMSFL